MTSSATATVAPSPSKKMSKGGRTNGAFSPGSARGRHRGLSKSKSKGNNNLQRISNKVPKGPGKPRRQSVDDVPNRNVLLHRLSLPSSSPSRTLLERIGGSGDAEGPSTLTDADQIVDEDPDRVFAGVECVTRVYTPEPGEVERFLESVIGIPPPPRHACLGNTPPLALETLDLPVDRLATVHDSPSPVSYSPDPSFASLALDCPLLGNTMPPPSPSTIEECRTHLVPVLLATAQARDPAKYLDSEQCLRLLSDDHCKRFFRLAKEMRLQLASRVSQKAPMHPKRDRTDDVDAWVRSTRSRFNSINTVVSDASRRDSDTTLVDVTGARLPPKAPRAMLQAKALAGAQDGAPYEAQTLAASPTLETHPSSATSLIELVHQVVKLFPTLLPTHPPETETDMPSAPVGTSTDDPSDPPVPSAHATTVPQGATDFVSHLPTEPGIWFRQQGTQYAEIVDVDIEVRDELFHMSTERRPFRLRMHLRLCSVPVGAVTDNTSNDTPVSLQDVDTVIARHALHWPKKGKLVVQVNPESERSQTWLPYTLESDPLDVTSYIRPGKNTFRFIQLSDLSGFTFVLAASPPPPEDEWRSWDWASLVEGARARSSSADDLSEFAHIPVHVRS